MGDQLPLHSGSESVYKHTYTPIMHTALKKAPNTQFLMQTRPLDIKGAFLLTNLNLDSSIENWIRLLTRWNIKSERGSVFTWTSLGRGYLETFGQRFM